MQKQSLYHLIQDTESTFSKRPVCWLQTERNIFQAVSYSRWHADIKRFSAYLLHKIRVRHQDCITLFCGNRYEWSLVSLGIEMIGAVDAARDCSVSHQEIKYILKQTQARCIVFENEKMLVELMKVFPEIKSIQHIISIESPSHYTHLPKLKDSLSHIQIHFLIDALTIGEELLQQKGSGLLEERGQAVQSDDLAALAYTSGTAGKPKATALKHGSFCWSALRLQEAVSIAETDRAVFLLGPEQHIAERIWKIALAASGASIIYTQSSSLLLDSGRRIKPTLVFSGTEILESISHTAFAADPKTSSHKLSSYKQKIFLSAKNTACTYMDILDTIKKRFAEWKEENFQESLLRYSIAYVLFPFYWFMNLPAQIILKRVKKILGGELRLIISAPEIVSETRSETRIETVSETRSKAKSEPRSDSLAVLFHSVGIPVLSSYGMTETTGIGILGELPYPRRGAVGKPLFGVEIELRDKNKNRIVRPGIKGTLFQKGPHVMQGYYKDEIKTNKVLKKGWLNSGDVFMWTRTGELCFIGRESKSRQN